MKEKRNAQVEQGRGQVAQQHTAVPQTDKSPVEYGCGGV
jgi:hypothetical protein